MKKYGFGIIGCGNIGKIHADIIKGLDNAYFCGFFDNEENRLKKTANAFNVKAYYKIEDMLEDKSIDIVSVCVPSSLHADIAVRCAESKKHIVVEKPIDITLDKAKIIIDACSKNDVKLCCILQHRFDEDIMKVKKLIEQGVFGKLLYGSCSVKWYRKQEYYDNSVWRGTWKYDGGGALMNQSIHTIDLLIHLMGPVAEVTGKCAALGHENIETEDIGLAVVSFENGAMGTIEGSTLSYPGIGTFIEIQGTKGYVRLRDEKIKEIFSDSHNLDLLVSHKDIHEQQTGMSAPNAISHKPHEMQLKDFLSSINNNTKPYITPEDSLNSLKVILAAYESSRSKKTVKL